MRFRLSTILLVILSIAILTGWLTDRSIRRNSEESIVDRERVAAGIFYRSVEAAKYFRSEVVTTDHNRRIALVRAILALCENENLYDASSYSFTGDAVLFAGQILSQLECNSEESFRELAVSLYPFMSEAKQVADMEGKSFLTGGSVDPLNEKRYPEFHETNSKEYIHLDGFLSRALNAAVDR